VLRMLTWNVLAPANPDWDRRSRLIAEAVRALDPDIAAFQEIPVTDDCAFVRSMLVADVHVAVHPGSEAEGVGAVLACRWPWRRARHVDLAVTERAVGLPWLGAVVAEVETPAGDLTVVHHKPSWQFPLEAERLAQAVRVTEALAGRTARTGAVLLGDLDATPDSASLRCLRGRDAVDGRSVSFQDAWETVHGDDPGHTMSRENPLVRAGEVATMPSRRIDYVLVSGTEHGPAWQVESCRRVLDRPVDGVWASDHAGVLAELAVPDHAPGSWRRDVDLRLE
jgi:endonuclease/exonuclease/phosphatase family metal-dependent hydrolase